MSLFEQITEDLKKAMLNKEKEKLEALRALKTAFLLARTEAGVTGELSADAEIKIVQKLIKQRKDTAEEYMKGNRPDLAEKELQEAEILTAYMPAQMSEAEITHVIKEIIAQTGATSIKEMGKIMGVASKKLAGKADNKDISNKIKELLS
ncbi:MAG: GatB/YqeY domain-containing protein [Bacteroidales bacterium]